MSQKTSFDPERDADRLWTAVMSRDPAADGRFIYAVTTTGIFCRPTCASRQPNRRNVRFFPDIAAAAAAGFRPCRRCRPEAPSAPIAGSAAVARAIAAIDAHVADGAEGPPKLDDLAIAAGLSPSHLQRRFTAIVGVSPRVYAEQRRLALLKTELRAGAGVADATFGAGFGSSSRVYEKSDSRLGMTPATYARGGTGMTLTYALADCSLGRVLVAASARGLAAVEFGDDDASLVAELAGDFPRATLSPDRGDLGAAVAAVVAYVDGGGPAPDLPLDIRATAFQAKVWQALTRIPAGETRTYGQIAEEIGAPTAARAVGTACGSNRLAVLIPCHRAVRGDGGLGGYRWGLPRKRALLKAEGR